MRQKMKTFDIFHLTKLMKRLSLNLEGEGEVLPFFDREWSQKLPPPAKCRGTETSSF
jgi:hypothetical protein